MITVDELERFKNAGLTYEVDASKGWSYGPSTITIMGSWAREPYWWGVCMACGEPALCTLPEMQRRAECRKPGCGQLLNTTDWSDYDWQTDRHMAAYPLEQEAFTSAYMLGGPEGVRAAAMGKHRQALASIAANDERHARVKAVIDTRGADLQEAQPEEP